MLAPKYLRLSGFISKKDKNNTILLLPWLLMTWRLKSQDVNGTDLYFSCYISALSPEEIMVSAITVETRDTALLMSLEVVGVVVAVATATATTTGAIAVIVNVRYSWSQDAVGWIMTDLPTLQTLTSKRMAPDKEEKLTARMSFLVKSADDTRLPMYGIEFKPESVCTNSVPTIHRVHCTRQHILSSAVHIVPVL